MRNLFLVILILAQTLLSQQGYSQFIPFIEGLDQTLILPFFTEESLVPQGNNCNIIEVDGTEYYDCTYFCLYEAEHWDMFYESKSDWQCDGISKGTCKITDKYDRFNFFEICFCWFSGSLWIYIPFTFLMILFIFNFANAVVEEFLQPGLSYISLEFLQLNETVAGCTFIAIANGANDVIVAVIAGSEPGGVSYNIGALYGSGLFVGAMVISITIFICEKEIKVSQELLYRDLPFYIFCTCVVLVFGIIGYIYWWSALIFLLIYVVYVVTVIIQARIQENYLAIKKQEEFDLLIEKTKEDLKHPKQIQRHSSFFKDTPTGRQNLGIYKLVKENQPHSLISNLSKKKISALLTKSEQNSALARDYKQKTRHSVDMSLQHEDEGQLKMTLTDNPNLHPISINKAVKSKMSEEQHEQEDDDDDDDKEWSNMNLWEKFSHCLGVPLDIIRKLTIPPIDHDHFDKRWLIASPCFVLLFCFWCINVSMFYYFMIGLPLGIVLTIILYFERKPYENNEIPNYIPVIAIVATISGLGWNYIMSELLVDMLASYIAILKLDNTFMGLTVLGIGNALDDALVTLSLAKKGTVNMAITSSYAGQLFGLLIGFGIAQMKKTLTDGPQSFDIFYDAKRNVLDLLVILIFLITLITTIIIGIKDGLVFNKKLGWILAFLYAGMIISAIGVQIWYIVTNANLKLEE